MRLTRYEQETIINFNEEEKIASVYTHNKALIRKLEQLSKERPEEVRLFKTTHWGQAVEYYVPKSWLKIKPPRVASEAQKQASRKAAEKGRFCIAGLPYGRNSDHDTAAEGNYIAQLSDIEKDGS